MPCESAAKLLLTPGTSHFDVPFSGSQKGVLPTGTMAKRSSDDGPEVSTDVPIPDQPGLGAKLTRKLADAAINLRGLSAAAIGRQCVCYLAFDTAEAAAKAVDIIKSLS